MANEHKNEIALLKASINGDSTAFESIVVRYQSLICAITYSATGNIETSEELAQEIFVKAWRDIASLRELSKFRSWICSIARTTISNHRKRQKSEL